jgi:hypothetical protein
MNQIQDKVKDLVEVRSNHLLEDFIANLAETLGGYYFTDITSDLMSKWLDRVVVMPTGSGNAYALAGYRGVGKSHFLAVFGAILSQPELRAKIKDSHVYASAERLIRRHYPVAYVRRGTKDTLAEELRQAVAAQFECEVESVGVTPAEIIKFASEKGGAGPSVFIIDTDIERESRVSRDDGGYLSELAAAAEGTNVFIAVALDDDVATADGRNSGISRSFTIDYLDHEHLYKIIDAHIFPKHSQKRSVITSIFENFRAVMPSFRWSEQRFASVYPLHPVILEVAPFVRLFVQDFALLAFASESGAKILNRPADSLVALDELFDRVEKNLRNAPDLTDAFAAYDSINEKLISKVPVMERLRSKLVLKGLMLLSLDSEGATANEIAAAMLIFDVREPQSAIDFVENLLEKISDASDGRVWKMERDGRAAKYGFSLSGKEHFNTALAEAVQSVPDSVVNDLLKRLMHDRFADCEFEVGADGLEVVRTDIEWHGGVRPGRLIWNIGNRVDVPESFASMPGTWDVVIGFAAIKPESVAVSPLLQWQPDALKPEEFDTFRRYHALMSREDLQQTFRDEFRTTIQTFTIAIEKTFYRKFLQYGKLLIDGIEHPITSEAAAGHNLSEVFGVMLSPYFEGQFPEHPKFGSRLEISQVDSLATGLFAARESISADVQKLAEAFAVPMGLADLVNGAIEVRPVEGLLGLHPVTELMELVSTTDGVVTMDDLQARLGAHPFGLTFEAQRLLFTALVARGVIEFVTTSGDRIGSRSLDLKLVWEDIAGVSVPTESSFSADRLVKWAALLTGDKELTSLSTEAARKKVKLALGVWLEGWRNDNLLETLDRISDDTMTTELWHLGSRTRKSFGAAADAVSSTVGGSLDIEPTLRMIQEAFSASTGEFEALSAELVELKAILAVLPLRRNVKKAIAGYEMTDDTSIEELRGKIAELVAERSIGIGPDETSQLEQMWAEFREKFDAYIADRHATSSRMHDARDRANEVLASREYWVFENLGKIDRLPRRHWMESRELLRKLRSCNCTLDLSTGNLGPPFCPACGFTLKIDRRRDRLPDRLWKVVNDGLASYERLIRARKDELLSLIEGIAKSKTDEVSKAAASTLMTSISNGANTVDLSENELRLLQLILKDHLSPSEMHASVAEESFSPVITAEAIIEDAIVVNS